MQWLITVEAGLDIVNGSGTANTKLRNWRLNFRFRPLASTVASLLQPIAGWYALLMHCQIIFPPRPLSAFALV